MFNGSVFALIVFSFNTCSTLYIPCCSIVHPLELVDATLCLVAYHSSLIIQLRKKMGKKWKESDKTTMLTKATNWDRVLRVWYPVSKGFIFEPSVNCRRAKSQLIQRKCRLCTQQEITLNVGNSVVISQSVVSQGSVMQSYDLVPRVRSETGRREPWKRGWQS